MPKKIMVVDNERDKTQQIKSILSKKGYDVVEAWSGVECLRKTLTEKPDLVLMDTLMPDTCGWELYNQLRKKDKNIKVAFLSVIELSRERREKLLSNGLSEYIKKPFTPEGLLEAVGRIMTEEGDVLR